MNLYVGSSGYSYKEWKGNFYPEDLATTGRVRCWRTVLKRGCKRRISRSSRISASRSVAHEQCAREQLALI